MKCKFCKGKCVKYGVQKDGTQRYKCKKCGKTQQGDYKYKAYDTDIDNQIVLLTKEGVVWTLFGGICINCPCKDQEDSRWYRDTTDQTS